MGWGVGPVEDEVRAREDGADGFTLHPDSFAVDYPDHFEAFFVCEAQVLFDDCFDVAWPNGMKIEDVRDLDLDRVWKRIIKVIFIHAWI